MLSKEIAEKIKEELKAFFGTELASFILYGSYADGKESKYSDTDSLVVVKQRSGDWRARRDCEIALRKILNRSVGQVSPRIIGTDIISATLRNFNPLLLNILKRGIPLLADGTFATVKEEFQRMVGCKINRTERRLLGGGKRMNKVFRILTKFSTENYNVEKKEAQHWSIAI